MEMDQWPTWFSVELDLVQCGDGPVATWFNVEMDRAHLVECGDGPGSVWSWTFPLPSVESDLTQCVVGPGTVCSWT